VDHVRPWSTVDHCVAARSAAARPPELALRPLQLTGARWRQLGRGSGARGLAPGLTGAQEAVERRCNGSEGGGGGALGLGSLGARREEKKGQGRSGEERGCRGALL
jgi:hypothetical protein